VILLEALLITPGLHWGSGTGPGGATAPVGGSHRRPADLGGNPVARCRTAWQETGL